MTTTPTPPAKPPSQGDSAGPEMDAILFGPDTQPTKRGSRRRGAKPHMWARWQRPPATNREIMLDRAVVAAICGLGALFATYDNAAPTGLDRVDGLWRAVGAVVVVLSAAFAPPIFALVSAVLAAASSAQVGLILVGAISVVLAIIVVWRAPDWHSPSALVGLGVTVIIYRLPHDNFLGISTLVALGVIVPVVGAALYEGPVWLARMLSIGAAIVATATLVSLVVFGLVMWQARSDLQSVADLANEAEQHFREGNEDQAQATLNQAVDKLASVESSTSSRWMNFTRAIPVLGQHTTAVQTVTRSGASTATAAEAVLVDLDRDALSITNGAVNLDAVRVMEPSVGALAAASASATADIEGLSTSWLLPPVADGLDRVANDIATLTTASRRADDAVRLAPTMLGGVGTRNHLVLFATPAELRGSVGLIGNWALVQANDGQLQLTGVGRASTLEPQLEALEVSLTEPARYVEKYGVSNIETSFYDITLSPDFPDVASVAAQLFEAATGTSVDTVMLVDPAGIAALLAITGPVTVGDVEVTETNARDLLLISQYILFDTNEERLVFLESLLTQTFTRLLTTDFPDPWDLDEVFAQVVNEDRIMISSTVPEEQTLLADLGVGGAFADGYSVGDDLLAVVGQNQGQNKIDSWLAQTTTYDVELDPFTGQMTGTISLSLANEVPDALLPDAVVGSNDQGLPRATNRLSVTVYSPHQLLSSSVDGVEAGFQIGQEFGVNTFNRVIDIPSGETVTIELEVAGELSLGSQYHLVVPMQATVVASSLTVRAAVPAGVRLGDAGPRFAQTVVTTEDQTFTLPIR